MTRRRKADVIIGTQWGDEGKGAEIDRRAQEADLVARYGGGNNAGHTTMYKNQPLILHLLPSSVAHGKKTAIGAGVVVDPFALINEVSYVGSFGVEHIVENLTLDYRAAMVMIWHRVMDMAKEIVRSRGGKPIGTTARGIGPAYADYASRDTLRIHHLLGEPEKLARLIEHRLEQVEKIFGSMSLTIEEWQNIFVQLTAKEKKANQRLLELGILDETDLDYTRFAAPNQTLGFNHQVVVESYQAAAGVVTNWNVAGDVSDLVHQHIAQGKQVLIEGAQGAHLDNYFGTFPYVTSSHTLAGGACVGLGIGPTLIGEVRGITKAYTTRVGNGPFPTVMADEVAAQIRGDGSHNDDEFGATTGRPRDCGWFDAVLVRSACRWSGVTKITLTKLDKLSGLKTILISQEWHHGKKKLQFVPADPTIMESAGLGVTYIEIDGWQENISQIRRFEDLPLAAQRYVERLEELLNQGATESIVIDRIGVGPEPDQFIDRLTA